MLNFGDNVNVILSRFRSSSSYAPIDTQVRRNGRIQINTEFKQASAKFFVMVSHKSSKDLQITEEVTGTSYDITARDEDNIPGITEEHYSLIMDGVHFLDKLNANKTTEALKKFVQTNTAQCFRYVCASPLAVFYDVDVESDYSTMISEYGYTLGYQIQQLVMSVLNQNQSIKMRPKKERNLMFNPADACQPNPFNQDYNYGLGREYSCTVPLVPTSSFAPGLSATLSTVHEE